MNSNVVFAYVMFPNHQVAQSICESLVFEGVIACANIFPPITSVYKWNGSMVTEPEIPAVLKLAEFKKAALMERIRAEHPYQNPCLAFLPIADGLPDFLNWVYTQSV